MKPKLLLPPALVSVLLLSTAGAAINISGSTVFREDFDTLPTAASLGEFDWTDNVTIPGFYLHRTNPPAGQTALAGARTAAGERPYVSSGSVIANGTPNFHGFLSLGAYDSTERALGMCPTGTDGATTNWAGGTLSIVALFTNTSTNAVNLTRIAYDVENYRANSDITLSETISLTSKTGVGTALLSELGSHAASATFNTTGYTTVNAGSLDLTSTNGFSTPVVPGRTPRAATLTTPLRVKPGETIALRWGNLNDGGTDAQVGIDNIEVEFVELTASVVPSVSNVMRDDNGTPRNPADDHVVFDFSVQGLGDVSPAGWIIPSGPLSGASGGYGVSQSLSVPIANFTTALHTFDVSVRDQANAAVTDSATVTAPWCALTATISGLTRSAGPTAAPTDDTWGYTVTVDGQFTGSTFTSDNAAVGSGNYGTGYTVSNIPIATQTQTTIFTDATDTACKATIIASPPRIIGTKNFGTAQPLYSSEAVPAGWVVNEAALTQVMNSGGGVPAKVYRSEVIDLSAVGVARFTGSLLANDISSGFEPADTFNAQLIYDGNTAAPVSLITAYDTITPADGVLTGAEISPATAGPPPVSGAGTWTHSFDVEIPESVSSVQLVISGNNDSANETMTVQKLVFAIQPHEISAALAGAPQFDNKGTVDPADDVFYQAVTITGHAIPAGSTGWTSDQTPAAGNYSDANPVLFGPFPMTAATRNLTLTDNGAPGVTVTIAIPSPVPALGSAAAPAVRNDNGTPDDLSDDTVTVPFQVQAIFGGPQFLMKAHPGTATATSNALSATIQDTSITLTGVPDHGEVYLVLSDASYPGNSTLWLITVPAATLTTPVLARTSFGAVSGNLGLPAGAVFPATWSNHPGAPAVQLRNGGIPAVAVNSDVLDLSASKGPVTFTANLHALDLSSGFEVDDSFKAELILDGDTANPVNLTAAYDTDASGVMNGAEIIGAHAGLGYVARDFALRATIADTVSTVQLVITAGNNSTNEILILEDALFSSVSSGVIDTDGDGVGDEDERIMGTLPNDPNSVTRLEQNPASPNQFSFNGVAGRFYHVYISDDNDPASHLTRWLDSGAATLSGEGPLTVVLPVEAAHARRYLRLHVMETEGPWPGTLE